MSISLDPPLDTELDGGVATGCEALGTEVLVAIAAGLAEVSTPWDLRPGDAPGERHYARILATDSYEAWLIYWPAGTGLDLHDHGRSAGAFAVVDGELAETTLTLGWPSARSIAHGGVSSFAAGSIHGVANDTSRPATSVHVYSPPLDSMTYYEPDHDGSVRAVGRDAGNWDAAR